MDLWFKLAVGPTLAMLGIFISAYAIRHRPEWGSPLGFLLFLSGGVIGALGLLVIST